MLAVSFPAGLLVGLLAAVPPPGVLVPSSAEPGIVIPPPVMVERELIGGFVLRHEEYLRWAAVAQFGKGFKILPRAATRLTLGVRDGPLAPLSLSLETVAAGPTSPGYWSARVAVEIPNTNTAIYLERTAVAAFSTATAIARGAARRGGAPWSLGFAGRF